MVRPRRPLGRAAPGIRSGRRSRPAHAVVTSCAVHCVAQPGSEDRGALCRVSLDRVSLEIPWESMTASLAARAWGTLRAASTDGDWVAEAVRRGGLYEALTFPAFLTAAGLAVQLITRVTLGVPTLLPLPVHRGAIVLWPLGHGALVLVGGMLASLLAVLPAMALGSAPFANPVARLVLPWILRRLF